MEFSTRTHLRRIVSRRGLRRLVSSALILGDIAAIAVAFFLGKLLHDSPDLKFDQVIMILSIFLPIYLVFAFNNSAHNADITQKYSASLKRSLTAFALTAASMMLIAFFMKVGAEFSRLLFAYGLVCGVLAIAAVRYGIGRTVQSKVSHGLHANLCIYDGVELKTAGEDNAIDAQLLGLRPNLDDSDTIRRLGDIAKGMDRVIIYCPPEARRLWADAIKSLDVASEIVVPEIDDLHPLGMRSRNGQTSLIIGSGSLMWNQKVEKRIFDIVVSSIGLLVLAPLLIAVAIAIKLDSKGPAIFRQERIGLGNRRFMILKFRSMRTDMEDPAASRLTERNDPRITRLGAFIRRTSIDELPQLINVLRGDMSIVGPRPHAELAKAGDRLYWEVDNAYWHRHVVKPGITGLAQIRGHRGNTFDESHLRDRLYSDLEYVTNWSMLADIRILFGTFAVLFHRNAF